MKKLTSILIGLLLITLTSQAKKINPIMSYNSDIIQIYPNKQEKKMLNIQRITRSIALTSGSLSVLNFEHNKPASIGFAVSFLTSILIHDRINDKLGKRLETYSIGSESGVIFTF